MQISDELVKYISAEIIKRLKSSTQPKAALLLVGKRSDLNTLALASLEERFCLSEYSDWNAPVPCDAAILITKLNIQALVRVAEGDEGCTLEGRALLSGLLNGQVVAAIKGGITWRRYQKTAPKALLSRYAECERVLQSYGLKLLDEESIVEDMASLILAPNTATRKANGVLACTYKEKQSAFPQVAKNSFQDDWTPKTKVRVLTECELTSLCPPSKGLGQTMRLNQGDILTPLAKDYIAAMKINVLK